MTYKVIWSPKSEKKMRKLDKRAVLHITKKMSEVAKAPHDFVEKVKTKGCLRVRAGDYRVFVDINKEKREIHVLTVWHRREAYK